MIEIRTGLAEGDRVLLSALANSDSISLDGSVLNREEDGTNRPLPKLPPPAAFPVKPGKGDKLPTGVRSTTGSSGKSADKPAKPEKTDKPARPVPGP